MSVPSEAADAGRLYRLAPIDKTGVMLGLSLAQVIVGGTGLLVGAIEMVTLSLPFGLVIAIAVGGVALLKRGGDAVLHQLPLFVTFAKRGNKEWCGMHRFLFWG